MLSFEIYEFRGPSGAAALIPHIIFLLGRGDVLSGNLPFGVSTHNAFSRSKRPLLLRLVENLSGHEILANNAI